MAGLLARPCVSKDARVPLQYFEITSGQRAPEAEGRAGVLARHPGVGQLAPGQHPRAQVVHHVDAFVAVHQQHRSEEHTSELQSLMRISYAVFCLKKKKKNKK